MKFCLSAKQDYEYLNKADEIMFSYADRKAIKDYSEKYPEATIILNTFGVKEEIKLPELKAYQSLLKDRFILAVDNLDLGKLAKDNGIKFFHIRAVTSMYELNALVDFGVEYVYVNAPLFFDLKSIDQKVGVRVYANEANIDGLPRVDGKCGPWLRPEDVPVYEGLIDVIEFYPSEGKTIEQWLQKERALYRIYAEEHEWPGDLRMIINNLGSEEEVTNRLIMPEFAKQRVHCKQRCQSGMKCNLCDIAFSLANEQKIAKYKEQIDEKTEKE